MTTDESLSLPSWFPYQHSSIFLKGDTVRLEWEDAQIIYMSMFRKIESITQRDHLPPHYYPHWSIQSAMGPVGTEVYTVTDAVVCRPDPLLPLTRSFPSCQGCWLRWFAAEFSPRTCLCLKAAASPSSPQGSVLILLIGLQSLRYLLSASLQKRFSDPWAQS